MDIQANKRNLRRVHEEGFGRGDLEVIDECVAKEAVDHHLLADTDFPTALKGIIGALRAAMPDLHHAVEDVVAEGDRVAARVVMTGTHTGAPLFGVPATGRRLHVEQFHIVRCDDRARTVEHWGAVGADDVMRQLTGAVEAGLPS